jgi:hypothetical protein
MTIRIVTGMVLTIEFIEILRIRIVIGPVMTIEVMTIRIVRTDDNSAWADNGPQRGLLEMGPVPSDRCGEIR